MTQAIIALGAIIISLLSFISTQLSLRRTVDSTYVASMEGRLKDAEARLVACEAGRERLAVEIATIRDENLWLTRKFLDLAHGGKLVIDDATPLVRRAIATVLPPQGEAVP